MGLEGLRTISLGGGGGVGPPGPSSSVGAQDTDSIATILTSPGSSNIFSSNLLLSPVGATTGFLSIDNSVNSGSSPGLVSQIQAYPVYEKVSSVLQLTGITTQVPGATFSIQVNQASGTTSGFLSFTDWNTFNSKQSALAVTDLTSSTPGMSIGNGISAVLGSAPVTVDMQQSGAAADGYLSSTDWNTFNNKQDTIGYTAAPVDTTIGGTYPLYGGGDLSANRLIAMDPATSATAGFMDINPQTFGGDKTFLGFINSPILQLQGASSGFISNIAGSSFVGYTLSWPIDQGLTNTVLTNDGQGFLSWTPEAIAGLTNALLLQGVSSGIFTQTVGPSFADYSITWPLAQGVTNSILMDDGQGGLTWEPTAGNGGLNYQESTSSGTFSSLSGSYVDVTNLTVTLTTSGNPVVITCIGDGAAVGQFAANSNGNTCDMNIAILEGSTIISEQDNQESDVGPSATFQSIPPSAVSHFYHPAAGTYTYKIQVKVVVGFGVRADNIKLVAYELIAPAVIRSIPAPANYAISSSSGSFSHTGDTTVTDVTNLTATITTSGNPVALLLISDAAADGGFGTIKSAASAIGNVFLVRDSTTISDQLIASELAGAVTVNELFLPASSISHFDNIAAGTYTYKVQVRCGDASTTVTATNVKLVAYEVIAPTSIANPIFANEVVSSACTSFSTASGSFVDVTNLTVSITTNGGRLVAVLMPTNGNDSSNIQILRSATDASGYFGLHNGTSIVGSVNIQYGDSGSNSFGVFSPASISFTDKPVAGTYTYKIQAFTDNAATLNVNDCILLMYEL